MGLTYVECEVRNLIGKKALCEVKFLVDSGAVYSVLPETVWKKLGLKSIRTVEFTLADGTAIERDISECRFDIGGMSGVSPVVLGQAEDVPLLGMVTLEVLGMMLNPLSRKLIPMRMMMA